MGKSKMIVAGLVPSASERFFHLILREAGGDKHLSIPIGEFEAQGICIALEEIPVPRPLPYDLFLNVLNAYDLKIESVELVRFYEGTFFANLVCFDGEKRKRIDARPSDALNMALRMQSPIYAKKELLSEVGYEMPESAVNPEEGIDEKDETNDKFGALSIAQLKELLTQYISEEDYEMASEIQKLIDKK